MDSGWPFAVLHHTGIAAPHFDLLIGAPGEERLRTWRIESAPESWPQTGPQPGDASGQIAARRMPDHRQIYLKYEGEISGPGGGRGSVRRIAEGTAELISQSPTAWQVRLRAAGWQAFVVLPLEILADPGE